MINSGAPARTLLITGIVWCNSHAFTWRTGVENFDVGISNPDPSAFENRKLGCAFTLWPAAFSFVGVRVPAGSFSFVRRLIWGSYRPDRATLES